MLQINFVDIIKNKGNSIFDFAQHSVNGCTYSGNVNRIAQNITLLKIKVLTVCEYLPLKCLLQHSVYVV